MKSIVKMYAYIIPTKLRIALNSKWKSFDKLNRALISAAALVSLSMVATTILFVSQKYHTRDIKCLAMNVYHEARGEPLLGQYAVAAVTLNRARSRRYPDDVCRVVYQQAWNKKYQRVSSAFSWTSDALDDIPKESAAWQSALNIARQVYAQSSSDRTAKHWVKGALFYHADYVSPRWAVNKVKITKIGKHIFYK